MNWFFESHEFNQWSQNASEILWLSGIAGDGKTTLAFCLRDSLIQNSTFNNPVDIAFYSRFGKGDRGVPIDRKKQPEAFVSRVLSLLIAQLLAKNPERRDSVTQHFEILGPPKPPII